MSATTSVAGESKMVVLKSSDFETFKVEESVAMMMGVIERMISDGCADSAIPVRNVTSKVLANIIEWCKHHKTEDDKDRLKKFDADFVKVEVPMLFDILLAANYLEIKGLLDITSQAVADLIKDKKPEEVRKLFNIENDFTHEEEMEIINENKWAFED